MGHKRALIVGINYIGTPNELKGCINDSNNINSLITNKFGFDDVRVLQEQQATTDNIKEGLKWLVSGCRPGDVLFFHYSGHGSQVADTSDPDVEPDYVDEIICPIDINWKDKIITDDYMKWIFDPVPAGVNLLVFLDCCHSGSGLDQANQYQPVAPDTKSIESGGRFLPPPSNVQALIDKLQLQPKPRVVQTRTVDDTGVLLAACGASQTSADAYIYQQYQGAGTFSFIYSLEGRKYNGTYIDVVDDMAKFMVVNKYSQRPELNGAPSAMSLKVLIPADVTQETLNNYEPPDATPAPNTTQSALIQSVFKMNTLTLISTVVGIGLILYGLISLLR